ncbi:SYK (predicted) [Pycnogonum litorale]
MSVIPCPTPDDPHDSVLENVSESSSQVYETFGSGSWGNSPQSQGPIPPESVPFYFEEISRETADLILWDRGCVDGMYLLRKSSNKDADYVLSLCFNNSVLHYRIKTFPDGLVGLAGMLRQKFLGPVELIEKVEGVACKPKIPCCRVVCQSSDTYFGLTKEEIRHVMRQKAQEWDIQDDKLDSQQNENYSDLKSLMLKTIHEYQPWFHGMLTREEAEKRMETYGHSDGKFLVRERDDSSYALCVSFNTIPKHYKIDVLPSGEFAIQAGQRFPNLMALIRHYMVCNDGLKTVLREPCAKPDDSTNALCSAEGVRDSKFNNPDILPSVKKKYAENPQLQVVEDLSPSAPPPSPPPPDYIKPAIASSYPSCNIYSNQMHVSKKVLSKNATDNQSNETKLSAGEKNISNTRKISLPENTYGNLNIIHDVNAKSQRRKSSPPESIESVSHPSHSNLIEELHNLSVNIPSSSVSTELTNKDVDLNESGKSHPVPAPRLSLNARSRSVDDDLQSQSQVNCTNSPDLERHRSPHIQPSSSSIATSNESSSALLSSFFSRIFGRGHKYVKSDSDPNKISTEDHSKKLHPTPFTQAETDVRIVNVHEHEKCQNAAKKPLLPPKKPDDLWKKDKPVPLPRRKISKEGKMGMYEHEDENHFKLHLIEENSETSVYDDDESLSDARHTDDPSVCANADIENQSSVDLQAEVAGESTPVNEPVYVDIDPTVEEEMNRNKTVVNWETNTGYEETLTTADTVSQNVSASCQQPPVKNRSSQGDRIASNCGGAKPKIIMEESKFTKVMRSNSISPRSRNFTTDIGETEWGDEPRTPPPLPLGKVKRSWSREKSDSIYRSVRRHRKNYINLDSKAIRLEEKIGFGNFGDVMRATYRSSNEDMDLAVKMLKSNSIAKQKTEILKEARTMARFDHSHIVRLIGVCEGDLFMLVMELAPLGPLHKYLKKHKDVSVNDIIMLMEQVAMAMEYLESKQYVHRDLAARNVLLVNEKFCKISDFGMSRALGLGRDYYRAAESGKWPLKWYAPECIYYFKFSCKSDVWSFGVTLWEALSYGEKPYQGLVGKEILEMFNRNERLSQPKDCPAGIYQLMWKCWQINPEERPNFFELKQALHNFTST